MTLVDLVYNTLKCLYQRDGDNYRFYSSFDVWYYLMNFFEDDFSQLGYIKEDFTPQKMDNEVHRLLGCCNGYRFRMHLSPDEDKIPYGEYWIPKS